MHAGGAYSLAEAARRVQSYRVIETRLFELLGGWVRAVPEPDVKICLSTHAARHGEHALLWDALVPALVTVRDPPGGADELVEGRLDTFLAALDDDSEGNTTADKLVGVYRVLLPAVMAAYAEHLAGTTSVSDGPLVHGLALVLHDEHDARREGEALIEGLVTDDAARARARARRDRLEILLGALGGLVARVAPSSA